MSQNTVTQTCANPAPLGLLGFSTTTILLNLHNIGLYPMDSMILGMGFWVGGIAQLIAGVMEFKKNNTFGATAFTGYGAFWLSLVFIVMLPKLGAATASEPVAMGAYLLLWGIFTLMMSIFTLKLGRGLQVVFWSLTVLFALLAIGDFTGNHTIKVIGGYEGVFCGLSALYLSVAQIGNEVYGKTVFPV